MPSRTGKHGFESVSAVDRVLAQSAVYRSLDEASRTGYRNAVEDLARHSPMDERAVADLALSGGAWADPGEALIGAGRDALERQIGYRTPLMRRVRDFMRRQGLEAILRPPPWLPAFIMIAGHQAVAGTSPPVVAVLILLLAFAAFDAALAMINFAITQLMRPMVLPGLSFAGEFRGTVAP